MAMYLATRPVVVSLPLVSGLARAGARRRG